jgi:hypothetical protein
MIKTMLRLVHVPLANNFASITYNKMVYKIDTKPEIIPHFMAMDLNSLTA